MRKFTTPSGVELPLMNLKGKDYLLVAHRIQWFRKEYPFWSIETEYIDRGKDYAICKATIKNEQGRIICTAHKKETASGFQDFDEKCETGAIGRALAMCGYGTQFAPEFEEGERLADAPLETKRPVPSAPEKITMDQLNDLLANNQSPVVGRAEEAQELFDNESGPAFPFGFNETKQGASESNRSDKISLAQAKRLYAIAKTKHWEPGHLKTFLMEKYQIDKPENIPWKQYKKICEWVESGTPDQVNKFWKP